VQKLNVKLNRNLPKSNKNKNHAKNGGSQVFKYPDWNTSYNFEEKLKEMKKKHPIRFSKIK